jgi:hypothetical protein
MFQPDKQPTWTRSSPSSGKRPRRTTSASWRRRGPTPSSASSHSSDFLQRASSKRAYSTARTLYICRNYIRFFCRWTWSVCTISPVSGYWHVPMSVYAPESIGPLICPFSCVSHCGVRSGAIPLQCLTRMSSLSPCSQSPTHLLYMLGSRKI